MLVVRLENNKAGLEIKVSLKSSIKIEKSTIQSHIGYAVITALFYGVCSGSMNFINKWVLNSWEFHYPNFMVFCQLALFAAVIGGLRATGKLKEFV